ncbi:MAG: hypothetical protein M3Q81_04065 [bacterium]|nr:hypothetical protein [bacterium]
MTLHRIQIGHLVADMGGYQLCFKAQAEVFCHHLFDLSSGHPAVFMEPHDADRGTLVVQLLNKELLLSFDCNIRIVRDHLGYMLVSVDDSPQFQLEVDGDTVHYGNKFERLGARPFVYKRRKGEDPTSVRIPLSSPIITIFFHGTLPVQFFPIVDETAIGGHHNRIPSTTITTDNRIKAFQAQQKGIVPLMPHELPEKREPWPPITLTPVEKLEMAALPMSQRQEKFERDCGCKKTPMP